MKTILSIRGPALPHAKRPELAAMYPQGVNDLGSFSLWLYRDDPRVARVTEWLTSNGYRPGPKFKEHDRRIEYSLNLIREYDTSDWEQAKYLEPHIEANDEIYHVGRNDEGVLIVGGKDLVLEQDFEITIFDEWIAPQRTRAILEQSELKGLTFAPVVLDPEQGGSIASKTYLDPRKDKPPHGGSWWEIDTSIKLPPLSPTMNLMVRKGNPWPPDDKSVRYFAKEGSYNHAELHFRRSDVEQMKPFNIACTVERFNVTPRFVVSKSFYQVCIEHGLKMSWVPVRLDNGGE